MLEKQNAEMGLMPVPDDEAGLYGYTDENRHMVECFRTGKTPIELSSTASPSSRYSMALYKSAEEGRPFTPTRRTSPTMCLLVACGL